MRQEVNLARSFCFYLYTERFEFLISILTPQGHDIMNVERTRLDKDEIEYLTENQRQLGKTLTKQKRKMIA
jgi:hypothetical protein